MLGPSMRASSSTVAVVLLCLRGARSAMAPAASYRAAGARAGVIGQLFPAVAQQLQPLGDRREELADDAGARASRAVA